MIKREAEIESVCVSMKDLCAYNNKCKSEWRVTHLKLQKSQKGDITHQYIA